MANFLNKQFLKLVGSLNAVLNSGTITDINGTKIELVKDAVVGDQKSLTKATIVVDGQPKEIICNFGTLRVAGLSIPFIRYATGKDTTRVSVVLKCWPERYETPEVRPNSGEVSAMAIALAEAGVFGEDVRRSDAFRAAVRALQDVIKVWNDKAGVIWGLRERDASHDCKVARAVRSCLKTCRELPSTPGVARHSGAYFEPLSEKQWNSVKRILKALMPLAARR